MRSSHSLSWNRSKENAISAQSLQCNPVDNLLSAGCPLFCCPLFFSAHYFAAHYFAARYFFIAVADGLVADRLVADGLVADGLVADRLVADRQCGSNFVNVSRTSQSGTLPSKSAKTSARFVLPNASSTWARALSSLWCRGQSFEPCSVNPSGQV